MPLNKEILDEAGDESASTIKIALRLATRAGCLLELARVQQLASEACDRDEIAALNVRLKGVRAAREIAAQAEQVEITTELSEELRQTRSAMRGPTYSKTSFDEQDLNLPRRAQ